MKKPFGGIQSVDNFHNLVVFCGRWLSLRMDTLWTAGMWGLIGRCWSMDFLDWTNMGEVKIVVCDVLREMNRVTEDRKAGRLTVGDGD
jgi:hypothetical protein